jgi:hypothetical protein
VFLNDVTIPRAACGMFSVHRLSMAANLLMVAIIYGPAVPMLYPSVAFVMLSRFWWDKVILLRFSAPPRLFDARVITVVMKWLVASIAISLVFSCWAFSNPGIIERDVSVSLQRQIGLPPGHTDTSASIGGLTFREIGDRIAVNHLIPTLVAAGIVFGGLGCYGIWRLVWATVFVCSCGVHGRSEGLSDIRIVQRRSVVEAALGSQCFLYGKRRRFARVNSEISILKSRRDRHTPDIEAQSDSVPVDKSAKRIAKSMEAAVRFQDVTDEPPEQKELSEFPGMWYSCGFSLLSRRRSNSFVTS